MQTLSSLAAGLVLLLALTAIFKLFPGAGGIVVCIIIAAMMSLGSMSMVIIGLLAVLISMVHGLGGFGWYVLGIGAMVSRGMI